MSVEKNIIRAVTVLGISTGVVAVGFQVIPRLYNFLNLDNKERDRTECVGTMARGNYKGELQNKSTYRGMFDDPETRLAAFNEYACGRWDFRKRVQETPGLMVSVCQGAKQLTVDDFVNQLTKAKYDGHWNFRDAREGYERSACPDRITPRVRGVVV